MEKPTVYIETTIPSYVVGRDSRDVVTLGHQIVTRGWWASSLDFFEPQISELVLREARKGDPEFARRRLELLDGIKILNLGSEAEELAERYLTELHMPQIAASDALHIAIAVIEDMDYLITWNLRHIAHARIRRALRALNDKIGLPTPTICTPEELDDESGTMDR